MGSVASLKSADPFGIVGTIVDGRYKVERVAGQGGFGVVYRAFHLAFESAIALKVLKLPSQWSSEKNQARIAAFQREGRVLFELSSLHPSIVRAFETGTIALADGSAAPYLALEWLDGVSLGEESSYRKKHDLEAMSLTDIVSLLHGPAAALSRAHARGIVHRDIKPGNLFVSSVDGQPMVKILDFGIAKIIEDSLDGTVDLAATGSVTSSFTPMYAAPEQWLKRLGPTGRATDVHALALVCVELLTGKPPLQGEDSAQLMAACLDAGVRPTPKHHGLDLSPEIEAVFAQAVALDPRARFVDIGAFWSALCDATGFSPKETSQHSVELKAFQIRSSNEGSTESHRATLRDAEQPLATGSTEYPTAPTASRGFSRSMAPIGSAKGSRTAQGLGALALGAMLLTAIVALRPRSPQAKDHVPNRGTEVDQVSASPAASHPIGEMPADVPTAVNAADGIAGEGGDKPSATEPSKPVVRQRHRVKVPEPVRPEPDLQDAEELLSGGQLAEACALGEAAATRAPTSPAPMEFLGRCYMRQGKAARARLYYRRYLAVAPAGSNAVFVRAMIDEEAP